MDDGRDDERQSRRDFLKTTAAAAATVAVGCGDDAPPMRADASTGPDAGSGDAGSDAGADSGLDASVEADAGSPDVPPPEATPEADEGFGLGVASGDVLDRSAIVWTRYDGTAPLRLTVWEMTLDGDYLRAVHDADVLPSAGGFVHVDVTGLNPGARHRYAFFELDGAGARIARSPIGRFRAALPVGAALPLLVGAVSCTRNGRAFGTLEIAGSRDDLDLFLFLGDTTYADGASTLDQYRDKWAENLAEPGYQSLRAATSALATWDDHEVENNWDPEDIDAAKLDAARSAFFENQPLRRDPTDPGRIWKSIRWGDTLEVFVLDCRGERKPSTRSTSTAEYVSPEQLAWLQAGLADSSAVFKLVMNSVPITDFPLVFLTVSDRWEGYAAQRQALLEFIDGLDIRGLLWVAGDFHMASAGRVSPSGAGASQVEFLVGPGAQLGNPLGGTLTGPQFDWSSAYDNYTTFAFDPSTVSVTVTWHATDGGVLESRTYLL